MTKEEILIEIEEKEQQLEEVINPEIFTLNKVAKELIDRITYLKKMLKELE